MPSVHILVGQEPGFLINVGLGSYAAETVMPLYTIDTDDAGFFVSGDPEAGFDCPSRARTEAHRVLGSMTNDALPDGEHRVLQATVRDGTGQEVYVATVTFAGEWKIPLAG